MDTTNIEVLKDPEEDPGYVDSENEDPREPDEPEALTINEDSTNLVPDLEATDEGKKFLKKLVQEIHDEFMQAWDKNQHYREQVAGAWQVLFCDLPPKSKPFDNCANAAIPLALQNIVRLTNKMTTEVFGDFTEPFNFIPTSPQSEAIAPIVTQHSNWQIRNRIPGYKRQMKRGLLIFAVAGDVACHSYYDPVTRQNCHECLTCDDYVVPYTHVSVNPDFSDVPWIARRFPYHKHRLKAMGRLAGWSNIEKVTSYDTPEYGNEQAETTLRNTVAEYLGEDAFGQKKGEYEIVQYEGWIELPGIGDMGEDGELIPQELYCQLIFDLCSKIPLKLTVHMRPPYHEKVRFEQQTQEHQHFQQAMMAHQQQAEAQQQQVQSLTDHAHSLPQDHPDVGQFVQQAQAINSQPQPPPPVPPPWMADGKTEPDAPRKEPIYMFAHGVCLEPMLGNLGVGLGRIDGQLNVAANTVWSMFLDASALGNGKTFITSSNVDFQGPFKIGPGVINKAKNVMPSDLQNAFLPLEFGQANPQLIEAADRFMAFGEQAANTPDIMSGASGKSGETARGVQARIEQVNAMIKVPTMAFADFSIQVMRNNCKLNAIFASDEEIFYVNRYNEDLQVSGAQMVTAAREMYDNEYEIELVSDLQFRSRSQKVSEADEIVQLPNAMPELQTNYAFKYHAIRQALIARGFNKIARTLLGPPPPLPQNTFGLPPGTPGTAVGPEQVMQQQMQSLMQQGMSPQQAQQQVQAQQQAQQAQQQAQQGQPQHGQQSNGQQKPQQQPAAA
jgi:hypothetical protein